MLLKIISNILKMAKSKLNLYCCKGYYLFNKNVLYKNIIIWIWIYSPCFFFWYFSLFYTSLARHAYCVSDTMPYRLNTLRAVSYREPYRIRCTYRVTSALWRDKNLGFSKHVLWLANPAKDPSQVGKVSRKKRFSTTDDLKLAENTPLPDCARDAYNETVSTNA